MFKFLFCPYIKLAFFVFTVRIDRGIESTFRIPEFSFGKGNPPLPYRSDGCSLSKNPKLTARARKQRFAARPAMRGGLRTAVALRAVLVLGAAHP